MIFAIILYAVLHDLTRLYIFQNLNDGKFISAYRAFQKSTLSYLKIIPLFAFIKNHLVDFLWFSSFVLFFTEFLQASTKIKFIFLIFMAVLSEFSQLFFEQLGTFDFIDLGGYVFISLIYIVCA